jgi:hypothetical protein
LRHLLQPVERKMPHCSRLKCSKQAPAKPTALSSLKLKPPPLQTHRQRPRHPCGLQLGRSSAYAVNWGWSRTRRLHAASTLFLRKRLQS